MPAEMWNLPCSKIRIGPYRFPARAQNTDEPNYGED